MVSCLDTSYQKSTEYFAFY